MKPAKKREREIRKHAEAGRGPKKIAKRTGYALTEVRKTLRRGNEEAPSK